jgi:xanthine dehydrogenase molybdopterin binding subunit/xanthine dehydrogenase small subunit
MTGPSSLTVNGVVVDVDPARVDPAHTPLSRFLRARGQTGTKEGCAEGDCGACTVAVADVDGTGAPTWRAVTSCIAPVGLFLGREIVTAEGLADNDGLHPVQAAMVKHLGSQCGYCTPGFVTSMFEAFERSELTPKDHAAIADQLCGNLCRCTGYRPIREAMCHALQARDAGVVDDGLVQVGGRRSVARRAHHPATLATRPALDVTGPQGRFLRPATLAELLEVKGTHRGGAVLVGGATELGVLLRKRATPLPFLVDASVVPELQELRRGDVSDRVPTMTDGTAAADFTDAWVVGGAVTLARLETALLDDAPMAPVVRMLRVFASRQVKNAATLAGNVATASPIGDMPPVLLALGALVEVTSSRGTRVLPIDGFFTGYRKTVLADDEVISRFFVPRPRPGARFRSFKVSKRRELDISIVAAAFLVEEDTRGLVTRARLAFGGVAATPALAGKASALLVGRTIDAARREVAAVLQTTFTPLSDVRADAAYRRGLIVSLWDRFVDGVVDEAHDGDQVFAFDGTWPTDDDAVDGGDVSRALLHDAGVGHVTGRARYVDDVPVTGHALEVWPVQSRVAHGILRRLDIAAACRLPGVRSILTAADIPGDNDIGAIRRDEPLLVAVGNEVSYHGQVLALVVADTLEQARAAAAAVVVEVEPLPAILGIRAAMVAGSFHPRLDGEAGSHVMRKGDIDAGLSRAPHRLRFELDIGGQEHFYLETQAAWAETGDDGDVRVWASTQHPSEVQAVVSHVLHMARHNVVVTSPRMGGGFGGKETQGNGPAALVALAATKLGRPVRLMWDRDVDMEVTGKRHPFFGVVDVGFDDDGVVQALRAEVYSDAGFALDLSESIHDRALFHLDNCYDIAHVELSGRVCKTHTQSHTAFRGFGGPQGMLLVEEAMTRVAQQLGLPGDVVRERNFYAPPSAPTHGVTPYGQVVDDFRVADIWPLLKMSSELEARRAAIAVWNATSPHVKRGIALTPVKFGISFTASFLNQAGALVVIYRDGSVQVSHGGTEMGQGLHTKILGIVMRELGVNRAHVRVMHTTTDKVPNTSATAASSGADLNGAAVQQALHTIIERLRPVAARLLEEKLQRPVHPGDVVFVDGQVRAGTRCGPQNGIALATLCEAAYLRQVSLSSTGYYRTPDIGYDKKRGHGKPFHYFAYGACVAEVELDGTTGMRRVRRVDVLHDVGDSLNPAIDRGQVEGGLVQGIGWLTGEELKWSPDGRLLSHSASTYNIPTFSDAPAVMKVALYDDVVGGAPQRDVIHGSKAVGEPPLMLAFAVREALQQAVAAFAPPGLRHVVDAPSPLTHEALFAAVRRAAG